MIQGLTVATPDQLVGKVYGFDDKMVITPGFEFTIGANEPVYVEDSGYTKLVDNVAQKIDTFFMARENAGKVVALNLGVLVRQTLPNNAAPGRGTYVPGFDFTKTYPALAGGKKTAQALVKSLEGRTIKLLAIVPYTATTNAGKPYNGKQYIWE